EVEVTLIDVTVEKVVVTEDDEAIVDVVGAELVVVEGTVAANVKDDEIEERADAAEVVELTTVFVAVVDSKEDGVEVEEVTDVVDVLALVDCGSADAIDLEVVDANIVDNIWVKDDVEVTDRVFDATDVADFESEVVEFNEVVDDLVEEGNTVVPVVITVTAFTVDSLAIKAVAASTSITADTTRMFNKNSTPDPTRSCLTL
ncbi:MAG: hypothetical protein ABSD41_04460, partial [Candidatus Bathyarchaeia archaeon]